VLSHSGEAQPPGREAALQRIGARGARAKLGLLRVRVRVRVKVKVRAYGEGLGLELRG